MEQAKQVRDTTTTHYVDKLYEFDTNDNSWRLYIEDEKRGVRKKGGQVAYSMIKRLKQLFIVQAT